MAKAVGKAAEAAGFEDYARGWWSRAEDATESRGWSWTGSSS